MAAVPAWPPTPGGSLAPAWPATTTGAVDEASRGTGLVVGVDGEVAEAERFADVVLVDAWVAGQVGDGPRDPQAAVEAARRQAQPVDRHAEHPARGRGRPAGGVEVGDGQAGARHAGPGARCPPGRGH